MDDEFFLYPYLPKYIHHSEKLDQLNSAMPPNYLPRYVQYLVRRNSSSALGPFGSLQGVGEVGRKGDGISDHGDLSCKQYISMSLSIIKSQG